MGIPAVYGRGWALLLLIAFPVALLTMRRRGLFRIALVGLLNLYVVVLAAITIFPVYRYPRWTQTWADRDWMHWWDLLRLIPLVVPPVGFILNVLMFVPFGVLVPLIWPAAGTRLRIFWLGLAASAVIEFSQLGLWLSIGNRRVFDVNDLISNTAGALVGFALLRMVVPPVPAAQAREPAEARR